MEIINMEHVLKQSTLMSCYNFMFRALAKFCDMAIADGRFDAETRKNFEYARSVCQMATAAKDLRALQVLFADLELSEGFVQLESLPAPDRHPDDPNVYDWRNCYGQSMGILQSVAMDLRMDRGDDNVQIWLYCLAIADAVFLLNNSIRRIEGAHLYDVHGPAESCPEVRQFFAAIDI